MESKREGKRKTARAERDNAEHRSAVTSNEFWGPWGCCLIGGVTSNPPLLAILLQPPPVHTHTHIHTERHTHTHTCACAHSHTDTPTHTRTHTHTHSPPHIHTHTHPHTLALNAP